MVDITMKKDAPQWKIGRRAKLNGLEGTWYWDSSGSLATIFVYDSLLAQVQKEEREKGVKTVNYMLKKFNEYLSAHWPKDAAKLKDAAEEYLKENSAREDLKR